MADSTNSKQNNSKTSNKRQPASVVNYSTPDLIEAISPLFLASVGTLLGIVVICSDVEDPKATAGLSLAGTAMAGAAGLARPGRSGQDFSVKQQNGNLEVETPADR